MSSNRKVVLICGDAASGKTSSFAELNDSKGIMFLNCEGGGKEPTFNSEMQVYTIGTPDDVIEAFAVADADPDCHTIVIDGLNYLMDMFYSQNIHGSAIGMAGWADYGQYFRNLMNQTVANSTKNVIFTAHASKALNEVEGTYETSVPVQGALKGKIESFFTTIIYAKKLPVGKIKVKNDMLNIDEDDEASGVKYVFQTKIDKSAISEKIRGPLRMWKANERFIDNNAQHVLDRLNEYYK